MTPEDELQEMLDQNPKDHQTRLVLADLLGDYGDPRATGYLMMGWGRLYPIRSTRGYYPLTTNQWTWISTVTGRSSGSVIKNYWYDHMTTVYVPPPVGWHHSWSGHQPLFNTRREAEDDLARAWLQVPQAKRDRDLADAVERYSIRT